MKFLLAKFDQIEKDLQVARERAEQYVGFSMVEMKKVILVEVSTLETTIQKIYDRFFIVCKVDLHLYAF